MGSFAHPIGHEWIQQRTTENIISRVKPADKKFFSELR
jgi:hypothetical protein